LILKNQPGTSLTNGVTPNDLRGLRI